MLSPPTAELSLSRNIFVQQLSDSLARVVGWGRTSHVTPYPYPLKSQYKMVQIPAIITKKYLRRASSDINPEIRDAVGVLIRIVL